MKDEAEAALKELAGDPEILRDLPKRLPADPVEADGLLLELRRERACPSPCRLPSGRPLASILRVSRKAGQLQLQFKRYAEECAAARRSWPRDAELRELTQFAGYENECYPLISPVAIDTFDIAGPRAVQDPVVFEIEREGVHRDAGFLHR